MSDRNVICRIVLMVSLCILARPVFGEVPQHSCVRDPFWPVGYKVQKADEAKNLMKTEMEAQGISERPVSEVEWEQAREKIPRPSGIFVGRHPQTDENVDKMILLGKTVYAGDQICTTNEFTAFTWQVDSISFSQSRFELSPVSAERLKSSGK